jgi:hypothetical protein
MLKNTQTQHTNKHIHPHIYTNTQFLQQCVAFAELKDKDIFDETIIQADLKNFHDDEFDLPKQDFEKLIKSKTRNWAKQLKLLM